MTRRTLRSNSLSAELQNGSLSVKDGEKVTLGIAESDESSSKAVSGGLALKRSLKDAKDLPLKDRLRGLREKGGKSDAGVSEEVERVESSLDGPLAEKASTSSKDLEKKNVDPDKVSEKAESLAILLDQGLTSGDAQKIDAVLSKTDVRTISATLNDLPVTQVLPLLRQIEYRLRNRSAIDIRCWIRWVQYVVSMHMAYLSALGNLEDELEGLFEWMRNRTAQMGKLCELYGKLALVTEQIERRANPHLFILQEPKMFFSGEDVASSEDSDELDEIEGESIASNDDWWDDEEIASDGEQGNSADEDNLDAGKEEDLSSTEESSGDDEGSDEDEETSEKMELD